MEFLLQGINGEEVYLLLKRDAAFFVGGVILEQQMRF